MQNGFAIAAKATRVIKRVVRFPGKTGKGKISPNTFASILAHPGKPISREPDVVRAGDEVCATWHEANLQSTTTSANIVTRVEISTAAHACRRGKLRHRSSPLNDGTFSVQTSGATSGAACTGGVAAIGAATGLAVATATAATV